MTLLLETRKNIQKKFFDHNSEVFIISICRLLQQVSVQHKPHLPHISPTKHYFHCNGKSQITKNKEDKLPQNLQRNNDICTHQN